MSSLRHSIVALVSLLAFLAASRSAAPGTDLDPVGPIPSRNLSPIRLLFLAPRPEGTGVPEQGELLAALDIGYANYFERHVRGAEEIFFDMEILRMSLAASYGLTPRLSLGLDLPARYLASGFLDGVADAVDRFVGTASSEREHYGKNNYRFRWLSPSGGTILDPSQGLALGDMVLSARYRVWPDGGPSSFIPALAGRADLKVPTGNRSQGAGSGSVDGAMGLAASKCFLGRFSASFDLNVVFPSHPDFVDGVETGVFVTLIPTLAGRFFEDRLDAVIQLDFEQTPYSNTRLLTLSKDSLDLVLGLRLAVGRDLAVHLAFTEDLVSDPSPDFQIFAGVSTAFPLVPRPRVPSDYDTVASLPGSLRPGGTIATLEN